MADNVAITAGTGTAISTEEVTTLNGGAVAAQHVQRVAAALRTADGVAIDLPGDLTNGLDVDITRVAPISTFHRVTTATANPATVKASPGRLRAVKGFNKSAVPFYVKFHDTAGAPTPGAGVVYAVAFQAGIPQDWPLPGGGRVFGTGIAITVVRDLADAGVTAVAAEDGLIEVEYE